MYETIFEPGREISNEELGARVRHFRNSILLISEVNHRDIQVSGDQMTIYFQNYPRKVYCNLTNIILTIIQPSPGSGTSVSKLTQDCNSKFDYNLRVRSDWEWTASFFDAQNALLAAFNVGSWSHVCGDRAIRLPNVWSASDSAEPPHKNRKRDTHMDPSGHGATL